MWEVTGQEDDGREGMLSAAPTRSERHQKESLGSFDMPSREAETLENNVGHMALEAFDSRV